MPPPQAKLLSAREDVLRCQHLQERFPDMLAPLVPGVRLLTGQYCVATGDAAAVAHFQVHMIKIMCFSAVRIIK